MNRILNYNLLFTIANRMNIHPHTPSPNHHTHTHTHTHTHSKLLQMIFYRLILYIAVIYPFPIIHANSFVEQTVENKLISILRQKRENLKKI